MFRLSALVTLLGVALFAADSPKPTGDATGPRHGAGEAERPDVHPAGRVRDRTGRRSAAHEAADRRRASTTRAGCSSPRRPAPTTRSRSSSPTCRTRSLRLVDTDGDGRFESGGVFADKLMLPQGVMWLDGSVYVGHPPVIYEVHRHRRRRRRRQARGVVRRQDADRLRQRPARPLPRPRRLGLLDQGRVRRAGLHAARRQEVQHPRLAHLPGRPDGTGVEPVMTGGMDNPVDVAFTPGRRAHLHDDVLPAPGRRQARRPDPRRLRRRLRQGPRPRPRTPLDRPGPDAGADPPRRRRPVRAAPLRVVGVRPGVPGQPVRLLVQHAQGHPARPRPRRGDVQDARTRTSSSPTTWTSTRPT